MKRRKRSDRSHLEFPSSIRKPFSTWKSRNHVGVNVSESKHRRKKCCFLFIGRELDITIVEGRAPEPILGIGVRQNGQLIGPDLNVLPGTLLQMDIYLDANSTSTYGLRVSYMDVTDQKNKEETIILNGYAPGTST